MDNGQMLQGKARKNLARMMMEWIWVALVLLLIQFKDCCGQNPSSSTSCNLWDVCGKYGICTQRGCECPNSFTPVDPKKREKGCQYQGESSTEVLSLTGFIYINNTDKISVFTSNISYSDCLKKVSSHEYDASYFGASSQLCYLVNPVGSLVAAEGFNTAFFHVRRSTNAKFCDGPFQCGSYGICNNDGRCSCSTSFLPIDFQNPSKACTQVNSSSTGFLNLTSVSYSSYQLPNNVSHSNASHCMEMCKGIFDCLVVFSQTNETCSKILGQVGTLANVTDSTFVTYLWINKTIVKESVGCKPGNGYRSDFLRLNGTTNCGTYPFANKSTCSRILGQVATLANLSDSNSVTSLWVNKTQTKSNKTQPVSNSTSPPSPLLKCDACGNYEIWSASGCSCPDKFVQLSLGCEPGSGYKSDFLEMNFTTCCGTHRPTNLTSNSTCKDLCGQNISCKAAFLSATGECVLMFTEVGSLKHTSNQTDVAFIRVNITNSSQNNTQHRKSSLSAKALAGIIVGIILFIVCLITLAWCYLVTCQIQRVKSNIECEEPINHVQNHDHEESKDIRADQKQEKCKDVSRELESGLKVYSSSEVQGMTKDYKNKISEDRFAAVYKAQTENGIHLAVKVLKITGDISAEISTISQMHHNNLVQLLGYCNQGSHRVLVYEYVVNDSLDAWIFNNIISPMSWKKRFNIITGIASGMAYLHEQQLLHLDLKAQNIFLDAKFDAKIGYFGLNRLRDNLIGTPEYVAPEYFTGTDRNVKMDMYSFGIILLEIFSAERVLNLSAQSVTDAVANCGIEDFFPSDLVDHAIQNSVDEMQAKIVIQVAFLCLQRDPEKRPSMADALLMLEGKAPLKRMPSTQEIMLQQCFSFNRNR